MKKLSKVLIPAIALLMASVIALTGATYAWFITGNQGYVGEFSANVVKADGIQMSWDAAAWTTTINLSDELFSSERYDAGGLELGNPNIGPAAEGDTYFPRSTTPGTLTNGVLNMYNATQEGDTLVGIQKANEGGYVKFDIYFNVTSKSNIVLDTESVLRPYMGDVSDPGSHWASRVAFVYHGVTTSTKPYDAYKLTATDASAVQIWEPNSKNHTSSGMGDGIYEDINGKYSYYGIQSVGTGSVENRKQPVDDVLVAVATKDNTVDDQIVFEDVTPGVAKITVYIWIEGQDADCTNQASGTNMLVNLQFERQDPTTADVTE